MVPSLAALRSLEHHTEVRGRRDTALLLRFWISTAYAVCGDASYSVEERPLMAAFGCGG